MQYAIINKNMVFDTEKDAKEKLELEIYFNQLNREDYIVKTISNLPQTRSVSLIDGHID